MRSGLVLAVVLVLLASMLPVEPSSLEAGHTVVQHTGSMQTTVAPAQGWTSGGEEVDITGSGFADLAFTNITRDGINHQWAASNLDMSSQAGMWNAIGVDSSGHIHVVQIKDDNYEIRHSVNDGSGWVSKKIQDCGNTYCWDIHMVIDDNDHLHLAYTTYNSWNETLVYMHYDGTTWTSTAATQSANFGPIGIAVDSNNHPHISYAAEGANCGNGLRLASHDGSSWSTQGVDLAGFNRGCDSAIVIDENDHVYIAYQDRSASKLKIATDKSGSWDTYLVDTGSSPSQMYPGYMTSMALDQQGQFHIAHFDDKEDDLRYATGTPNSGWTTSIIDASGHTGREPSIAVDAADQPHIVYRTWSNWNLKYATIDPITTDWDVSTIANGADVGEGNSIFIDGQGTMHVAFSDETSEVLKYTTKSTGVDVSHEITVKFGTYGSVTGTVVNDTTIRVTTPSVSTRVTVDLSLVDKDGSEHLLSSNFQFIDQNDLDGDGVLNADDDCPEVAGNSTQDQTGCPDDDDDGYSNTGDAFPSNSAEWMDTDGDGVGNNADAFPNDATETEDSDGDGVGNNADAFPFNPFEIMDSDGDGVGDNNDAFPNNPGETADTDGDGVGDNGDAFPANAFEQHDSDGDGVGDNNDAFPNDSTQSSDSDGDGVGDVNDLCSDTAAETEVDGNGCSPAQLDADGDGVPDHQDIFPLEATQWTDADGDGYGDNWGDASWNESRSPDLPGAFVLGAVQPDHCPSVAGNSTADGHYGCLDADGDGVPDQFQAAEDNQTDEANETQAVVDSDGDGVADADDQCPGTSEGVAVDARGCLLPSSQNEVEEVSTLQSLFAGEAGAVTTTVGIGAILLALFSVLQTNAVAAVLPDAFRWVQVLRKNSKLSQEESNELSYLQSLVQAYHGQPGELREELSQLKADLTARYTNNEIKKETREKLFTLIDDLLVASPQDLYRVAHTEGYFGLEGAMDSEDRSILLREKIAMSDLDDPRPSTSPVHQSPQQGMLTEPSIDAVGLVKDDGYEWYELPQGSGVWWYRTAHSDQLWQRWQP